MLLSSTIYWSRHGVRAAGETSAAPDLMVLAAFTPFQSGTSPRTLRSYCSAPLFRPSAMNLW